MHIFGYRIDRSVASERVALGPLDAPVLHRGEKNVGCIVLHGVSGTPANMRAVSDELIARGYSVDAPMLAGHGETVEKLSRTTAEDFVDTALAAYERLRGAGCEKIICIGLSLGGLITGVLAEEKPLAGTVLICPPVVMQPFLRVSAYLSLLFPFVRYEKNRKTPPDAYHNGFDGMATRKLNDIKRLSRRFLKNADRIRCPLLTVAAGRDDKVDEKSYPLIKEYAVNAPQQHIDYPNSKHGCTYGAERDKVAKAVADFVDQIAGAEQE